MFDFSRSIRQIFAVTALAVAAPILTTVALANVDQLDWTPHRDDTLGFSMTYPAALFRQVKASAADAARDKAEGRSAITFVSRDGKARLVAGAAVNTESVSITGYRRQNLAESYGDAKITYSRTADTWFVVSGNRGDEVFYERVSFTCGGRVINIWAITYPEAEGALYDRVVERIARSFRSVNGPEACKQ
jgi:hypothetical protein